MKPRLFSFSTGLSLLMMRASVAFADVQPEPGLGFPKDYSLEGHRIDFLIESVSIPIIALFVLMVGIMVTAMIKFKAPNKAVYDHGTGIKNAVVATVISSVIFVGVDGWLFYHSSIDVDEVFWAFPDDAKDALRIEVNAQQWAWNFRYAGPDNAFNTKDDIVTLNDMRVPTNRPILLKMTSKDVIHSFYLPNLRVKMDAVPGNVNRTWFQATTAAEVDIACAQHCGTHHYLMKGKLTILDGPDYERWAKTASAVSARAFNPDDKDAQWGWDWDKS